MPVNADFEGGFAVEPEGVAANVTLAVADRHRRPLDRGFDRRRRRRRCSTSRSRSSASRAARAAIDASGTGVLLTGRSEGFIAGRPDLAETIRRLTAYADAGADCLYAPGLRSPPTSRPSSRRSRPKPVNVLVGSDFTTVAELAALGVRRISVGGALARAAWGGLPRAPRRRSPSTARSSGLDDAVPFAELDDSFREA